MSEIMEMAREIEIPTESKIVILFCFFIFLCAWALTHPRIKEWLGINNGDT
jgi:hypothetical protein